MNLKEFLIQLAVGCITISILDMFGQMNIWSFICGEMYYKISIKLIQRFRLKGSDK